MPHACPQTQNTPKNTGVQRPPGTIVLGAQAIVKSQSSSSARTGNCLRKPRHRELGIRYSYMQEAQQSSHMVCTDTYIHVQCSSEEQERAVCACTSGDAELESTCSLLSDLALSPQPDHILPTSPLFWQLLSLHQPLRSTRQTGIPPLMYLDVPLPHLNFLKSDIVNTTSSSFLLEPTLPHFIFPLQMAFEFLDRDSEKDQLGRAQPSLCLACLFLPPQTVYCLRERVQCAVSNQEKISNISMTILIPQLMVLKQAWDVFCGSRRKPQPFSKVRRYTMLFIQMRLGLGPDLSLCLGILKA